MATPATVTIGISASLTGQFATQGRQALAGLAAWTEYANESGGLLIAGRRHPVTLVHYDDASVADNARATPSASSSRMASTSCSAPTPPA